MKKTLPDFFLQKSANVNVSFIFQIFAENWKLERNFQPTAPVKL